MQQTNYKNRWLLVTEGILFIVLGTLTIINPFESLVTLMLFFGGFMIFSGAVLSVFAIVNKNASSFFTMIVKGVFDILIGLVFFNYPELIISMLNVFFSILIVAAGLFLVSQAIRLKNHFRFWKGLMVVGLIMIIPGVIIFFNPVENALIITILAGVSLLFYGVSVITKAFRLTTKNTATDEE